MTDGGRKSDKVRPDRSEGFGERLLGVLLDRAHEMPPQLIAPLVAEEVGRIGGRDVSILLQDYDQLILAPLPGMRLVVGEPERIDDSQAGRAFLSATTVEQPQADGVRMFLPLLDGSDEVGVLAVTLSSVDDDDRRLLRRLAGLVADMLVTKNSYTDQFFQARRRESMSLAAEIQWSLLPPLTMIVPQVAVAGILEPAYDVAGDSFDYALNDNILHMAIIDAMGHGLDAADAGDRRRRRLPARQTRRCRARRAVHVHGQGHRRAVRARPLRHGADDAPGYRNRPPAMGQRRPPGAPADPRPPRRPALESPGTLPVGFGGAIPQSASRCCPAATGSSSSPTASIEEHHAGEEQFGEEQTHRVDQPDRP